MNRKEEYNRLLSELDNTPPALEHSVTRAKIRAQKKKRMRRFIAIPAGSVTAFLVIFVVMVNVSVSFAAACNQIPLLRELAAAVDFSPSLKAAVENEYVQSIGLEQSAEGITMRVEYVIVDQKQLNIFYSLKSQIYSAMDVTPSISHPDGELLEGYSILHSTAAEQGEELRQITVDFMSTDRDMPDRLLLTCKVYDSGSDLEENSIWDDSDGEEYKEPEYITIFDFTLNFDTGHIEKGEEIDLDHSFVLDGQRLTVTTVEIYPTHIRLNLADDEKNTAWLKSLNFYIENEKGEHFEGIRNGITATGSIDSPFMASHRLESPFFSQSRNLTLYITEAVWLAKDMERVKIDLAKGAAQELPQGVTFTQAVRMGSDWQLSFLGTERKKDSSYRLFDHKYYDEGGKEYEYNSMSLGFGYYYNEETGKYEEVPGRFSNEFLLRDYPFDTVYLSPAFSHWTMLTEPVEIKIK
jgi:hypothetical protein